jgi:hypothetical protein
MTTRTKKKLLIRVDIDQPSPGRVGWISNNSIALADNNIKFSPIIRCPHRAEPQCRGPTLIHEEGRPIFVTFAFGDAPAVG